MPDVTLRPWWRGNGSLRAPAVVDERWEMTRRDDASDVAAAPVTDAALMAVTDG
jgi:hypothetical protein